jgi:microcompartment protein CcmL/EutN
MEISMNDAIGIVEMYGFVTAITAADAAAKAADVKIIAIDSNKPANAETEEVPLIMAIKLQGEVSAVRAAVDAAVEAAKSVSGVICSHVISGPTDDAQKMAERSSVGRDIVGHIKMNA